MTSPNHSNTRGTIITVPTVLFLYESLGCFDLLLSSSSGGALFFMQFA